MPRQDTDIFEDAIRRLDRAFQYAEIDPEAIERLISDPSAYREQIEALREETVFNVGKSGRVAADHLAELSDTLLARTQPQ